MSTIDELVRSTRIGSTITFIHDVDSVIGDLYRIKDGKIVINNGFNIYFL